MRYQHWNWWVHSQNFVDDAAEIRKLSQVRLINQTLMSHGISHFGSSTSGWLSESESAHSIVLIEVFVPAINRICAKIVSSL